MTRLSCLVCDNSDDPPPEGTRMCNEKMQVLLPGRHCTQVTICMVCFGLCRQASALTKQIKKKVEATEQSTCPGHDTASYSCQTLLQIHDSCCAEDVST